MEEAQARLSVLAQNNKLWSQQMYLDVGAEAIHLRDVQSQVRTDNLMARMPVGGERLRERHSIQICLYNNYIINKFINNNKYKIYILLQDELEKYSFKSIFRCNAINTEKRFPSLLMLICQSEDQKKPEIHFFNCEAVKVSKINRAASQSFLLDPVCQLESSLRFRFYK